MACEAYACNNKFSKKNKDITFHRFPKDPILRKAWILAVRRKDFEPDYYSLLCSEHFEESDYEEAFNLQGTLKDDAVPSIFKTHSVKPILSKKPEPGGGNACSVALCYSNSRKAKREGLHLKFFTFPQDPVLRKEWVKKCQRTDKFDPTHKRVCSLHFTKEDYEDGLQAKLMHIEAIKLKKTAVPSRNLPSMLKPAIQPSQRGQRYAVKVRKQVVEECLNEYDLDSKIVTLFPASKSDSTSKETIMSEGEDGSGKQEAKKKRGTKRKRRPFLPNKRKNVYEGLKKVLDDRFGQNTKKVEISDSGKIVFIPDSGCWVMNDCIKCPILQKEIESLKQINEVHKKKERDLEMKLSALEKQLTDPDVVFEEKAKEAFKSFLSANQVNVALRKKTKTWWTQEDMSRAFSILYFSKECYLHLRNTLHYPLPGLSTLRKWTSDMEKKNSTEGTTVEGSDAETSELVSPEDQQMESVGVEPGLASEKCIVSLSEEENSNDSLNLDNQQLNMFTQCNTSERTVEPEGQPVDNENSNGSLNLGDKQIKKFCMNENTSPENVPLENATAKKNSAAKTVSSVANKGFQFQSYLQNYLKNRKQLRSLNRGPPKIKPFTCSVCHQGFDTNGALKNHFKMHLSEKEQFRCDVCDEDFISKFLLEMHIQTHKTDEKFVCDICDKSFLKKSTYKDHYVLHKNLKQKIEKEELVKEQCMLVYAAPASVKTASNNKYLLTRYTVPKTVKPFMCHICEELFDGKLSLKNHLSVHVENEKKTNDKQYTCDYCNREFKYYHYFKEHLVKCAEKVIFECSVCDKPFSSEISLEQHMAVHETRTFFCEICNNGFEEKSELAQHMKEHSDDKLFACYWCFKRFAHKDILKEHVKAHKNEISTKRPATSSKN